MKYFEVTRREMSEATKVTIHTNDYEPICGIEKMRIIMEPATSDYSIVRKVSQMLCYIDAAVVFKFFTVMEQYYCLSDWIAVHEDDITGVKIFISSDDTIEHECVFAFDNCDDFEDFMRALKNNMEPWYINDIKIDIKDGSQIALS